MASPYPTHVGILLDGNRHWAKANDKDFRTAYKRAGEKLLTLGQICLVFDIPIISVWVFCQENFNRPQEHLEAMFQGIEESFRGYREILIKMGVQLRVIGDLKDKRIPESLVEIVKQVVWETRKNDNLILNLGVNYSGRKDILKAILLMLEDGYREFPVDFPGKPFFHSDEAFFEKYLSTAGLPNVDLMIYTGRHNNRIGIVDFLLWQAAGAEIYSANVYFPDFTDLHFRDALQRYCSVYERRKAAFGEYLHREWSRDSSRYIYNQFPEMLEMEMRSN